MKPIYRLFISAGLIISGVTNSYAFEEPFTFEVDGISYQEGYCSYIYYSNIPIDDDKSNDPEHVCTMYRISDQNKEEVVIPGKVTYDGVEYTVVHIDAHSFMQQNLQRLIISEPIRN